MDQKKHILFVCLGNICRSPAAEGIFRYLVSQRGWSERYDIDSAGTYGGHAGELPDARMRHAAARRGYVLTHRARRLVEEDFERFDQILVMDDSNYEHVHRIAPSRAAANKISRMTDYCCNHPDVHFVPDPYYEGQRGFEQVLDLLENACEGLLSESEKSTSQRRANNARCI